jgi:methionyl-tRNA formyltransferase
LRKIIDGTGVDTGKIIDQRKIPIKLNDTIKTLYSKVEQESINMLRENIPLIINNTYSAFEQSEPYGIHRKAWPPRSPEDGIIDWSKGSLEIYNFVRAQTMPYPGAFTYLKETKITIWECKLFDWSPKHGQAGEVIGFVTEGPLKGILVATKDSDCPLLFTHLRILHNSVFLEVSAVNTSLNIH